MSDENIVIDRSQIIIGTRGRTPSSLQQFWQWLKEDAYT